MLVMDNNVRNGFVDESEILPLISKAINLEFNIGFRGPTGCGKTYLIQELAKQFNKKLWILNMTVDTLIEEIKGRLVPTYNEEKKELEFRWVNGVLVDAMQKGDWIVIEEANFMNEELASVFYSVMDHRRNIQLDEHKNELITAHKDFRLFLTMNWGYRGTTNFNDAIKNRIDAWFDLKYLSPEKEVELLLERTNHNGNEKLKREVAKKIVDVTNQFRNRDPSENLPDISTRILLRWASMVGEDVAPEIAAEHSLIPLLKYNELEKAKIREVIKTAFEVQEPLAQIKRGKIIDGAVLGDGTSCKVGDAVKFVSAGGSEVLSKIISILSISKSSANPDGIRVNLEDGGWMPPSRLRMA